MGGLYIRLKRKSKRVERFFQTQLLASILHFLSQQDNAKTWDYHIWKGLGEGYKKGFSRKREKIIPYIIKSTEKTKNSEKVSQKYTKACKTSD